MADDKNDKKGSSDSGKKDPWRIGGEADQGVGAIAYTLIKWVLVFFLLMVALWAVLGGVGCGITQFTGGNSGTCAFGVASVMLQFGGIILTFATSIFDLTLQRGVLWAGYWLRSNGAFGTSIATVWTILRDVVNLVLIGGLVWTAISMILNTGKEAGKVIVHIIIAALLVNFSFFFAGAILDSSGFVSRIIYQEAFGVTITEPRTENKEALAITNRFMAATHLNSVYDFKKGLLGNAQNLPDYGVIILIGFIGLLLFIFAAWTFIGAAALFTQRFIIMIILLITAPIGILSFSGIPTAKDLGKGWWSALYSQAVFPPVLLLLFAASFKVFEDASAQLVHEDASFLGLFSGPDAPLVDAGAPVGIANNTSYGAAWELIIIYIIAIALMYASMKIATNIARQEQVKVPTTGQFYGAYRKVAPAVFKGAAGAAKVVGRIPVPFVKDNIGQLFTRNLQLQSKVLLPAGRLLSPEARREKAVSKKRVDAYRGARDDAEKKKGTPEYENALIGAAERWDRLTDVEKTTEKNSNVLKKDKKKQDVQYDVEANAGQTGRTVVQTAQGGAPVPQQSAAEKAQATTNATVNAIKDMDKHQAATYLATKNLEILDMMKEKTYAQAFVGALRTQGKVASLPPEVLKHPNVAPELHLTEVVEIAGDKERFSDDQFVEIMGNVSEDVHKRFKTHPAKAGRKKAMKRVPDARKRAMKRLEDSRKNPEPADETNS